MTLGLILGLRSRGEGNLVQVGSGWARDAADQLFLVVPQDETRTLDVTTVGIGGLEAPVAPRTAYALYVVQTTSGTALIGSTSFAGPNLPGIPFRRIGSFATDAAGAVVAFQQLGSGNDREVRYLAAAPTLAVLRNGDALVFTPVECAPLANGASDVMLVRVVPSNGVVSVRPENSGPETDVNVPSTLPIQAPNQSSKLDFKVAAPGTTANVLVLGHSEVV